MGLQDITATLFDKPLSPGPVLFRVDAGHRPGLSFGHLCRCLLLSRALRDHRGVESLFLMADIPEGTAHAVAQGARVEIWRPGLLPSLAAKAGALIIDLPGGPASEDLETAKRLGLWTVVIDDQSLPVPWADAVLNGSVLAVPDRYPPRARLLLGPRYALLPDTLRPEARIPPAPGEPLRVLVSMGGSDPTGLTVRVMETLRGLERLGARFRVVLGPGFGETEKARSIAAGRFWIELAENPPDLTPLMLASDLAVCAGGQTLYELNALGVPVLAIASTPFEARVIMAFRDKGLLAEGWEAWEPRDFLAALREAARSLRRAANPERMEAMP